MTQGSPEGTQGAANPYPEERVTEAPVISPVAEAVARADAGAGESLSVAEESIAAEAKQSELKFDEAISEKKVSGETATDSNPSHDQQQPA